MTVLIVHIIILIFSLHAIHASMAHISFRQILLVALILCVATRLRSPVLATMLSAFPTMAATTPARSRTTSPASWTISPPSTPSAPTLALWPTLWLPSAAPGPTTPSPSRWKCSRLWMYSKYLRTIRSVRCSESTRPASNCSACGTTHRANNWSLSARS